MLGLAFVGGSAVGVHMSNEEHKKSFIKTLFGLGLCLAGQVFQSIQYVLEENLMKGVGIKPINSLFLVGSEGIAGSIVSFAVVYPVVNRIPGKDHGSYENFKNDMYMLFHNNKILLLVLLDIFGLTFYNWSSFAYTKYVTAVAKTILHAITTIFIWATMVILHYTLSKNLGEAITYWAFLEGAGFVLMILGSVVFKNTKEIGEKWVKSCCCCLLRRDTSVSDAQINPLLI